jgi:hypothetical protein
MKRRGWIMDKYLTDHTPLPTFQYDPMPFEEEFDTGDDIELDETETGMFEELYALIAEVEGR